MARLDTNAWRDAPLRRDYLSPGRYNDYLPAGLDPADRVDVWFRNGDVWHNVRADFNRAMWRDDGMAYDIVAWRPTGQSPEYVLRMSCDEAVLLAATLGVCNGQQHRVKRAGAVTAAGGSVFNVLADAFDQDPDYRAVSDAYHDALTMYPVLPDVELGPADESAPEPLRVQPSPASRVDVATATGRHDRNVRVERVVCDAEDPVTVYAGNLRYRWNGEAWTAVTEPGTYLARPDRGAEPDLPAPTGYVVLRRRPVPGDTVWPRWLEPAPGSGERNALAAARTVHDVDRDDDGNVRVWVGPDRTDGAYVWRDDRQRYVLTGFDVDLLSDDRYVRPWHDVRPGQTVAVAAGLDDPRPDEYCVTEVDRHVSGRVTGIRVGHDDDFYRPDDHDRFAGPYVPEVKLVWPR